MGLIAYLILCVVVGVIVWLAVTYLPMPPAFKTFIPVAAIIVLVVILLVIMFGGGAHDVAIPRLR
jgi:hypothetical protein